MAHIALTFYDLETGGISLVAVYLTNRFASAGHRALLVLSIAHGDLHGPLARELIEGAELVVLRKQQCASRALGQAASWPGLR